MLTAIPRKSAKVPLTDSEPLTRSSAKAARTFESPELEPRLNGEAEAEREDRAKRALLVALGGLAGCD